MIEDDPEKKLVTPEQIAHLDRIFDLRKRIETKEDLLELAELVEDESDESGIDDAGAGVGG